MSWTNAEGTVFYDLSEIKRIHKDRGGHYFDAGAIRFFRSRVSENVHCGPGGVFFVDSIQFESSTGYRAPREYKVMQFLPEGDDNRGFKECGRFDTGRKAHRYAEKLASQEVAA